MSLGRFIPQSSNFFSESPHGRVVGRLNRRTAPSYTPSCGRRTAPPASQSTTSSSERWWRSRCACCGRTLASGTDRWRRSRQMLSPQRLVWRLLHVHGLPRAQDVPAQALPPFQVGCMAGRRAGSAVSCAAPRPLSPATTRGIVEPHPPPAPAPLRAQLPRHREGARLSLRPKCVHAAPMLHSASPRAVTPGRLAPAPIPRLHLPRALNPTSSDPLSLLPSPPPQHRRDTASKWAWCCWCDSARC